MDHNYQKKIEKISQAVYLASHHLKDNEPLKWELRKLSIALIAAARSLLSESGQEDIPTDLAIDTLSTTARDLVSLLTLALVSGLISRNNAGLIVTEIESALMAIKRTNEEYAARAGFVLSEDFFQAFNKRQNGNVSGPRPSQVLENKSKGDAPIKDKKESRQARIISLLKSRPNLTIKDFAMVIIDCSEKTIQRELIDLVEKGIVKREGERRWSKYSLK